MGQALTLRTGQPAMAQARDTLGTVPALEQQKAWKALNPKGSPLLVCKPVAVQGLRSCHAQPRSSWSCLCCWRLRDWSHPV